jgi:hypothetical protein
LSSKCPKYSVLVIDIAHLHKFSFCIQLQEMKGSPGTVVKLLPYDHEVMGSSIENNLEQKCREILCT